MSIKLMSNILELDLPSSEKFTLLVMADFANDEGKSVYPSQETIAYKTSLSRQTVNVCVASLVNKELITKVGRRTPGQLEYELNCEYIRELSAIERAKRCQVALQHRQGVKLLDRQVSSYLTDRCQATLQNPLDEPSVESLDVAPEPERIPVVYANNEYVEVEDIKETKPKHGKNYKSLISAVASVCKMDIGIKTQAGQVGKAARELDNAGYTPDQVYDFLDWWKKFDWRWQKEHRYPSPHELLTTISKTVEEKKPEPTDEYLRSIGYK
jgi:hypothetical protein